MSAPSGNAGWTQLRQQARNLESQTQTLFHTYSQFASAPNIPAKPSQEERETESKIEELLEKRETTIAQLARLLDSEAALTSSAVKQNNLSLLRENLANHRRDLTRLRANVKEARDRSNLLGSVRDEIKEYRANNPEAAEAEYMADEGRHIDRSHEMTDSLISQAYAIQDSFLTQGETMASINRRITLAASKVPGINTLIGRISAKKRRDGIIMGSFIAFCFVLFFFLS
ncbi:Golgi SNAP receptor complex member-like protein [Hapsidospora chrysogenum ATCC 11550]|uniref:Golgi SNAP receptor complex member 1 n=1 Tax=Hapsidospora chrysogenum (strain ATCC 11550 / CBS 779.69 / DSM 880 / IAM 14645 / JCM 23072 / IMI 49137) TaxID=857340 RepID=A0A086T6I7_HAPC1|nr:Golgi SNAP receptor complex member-like protein [Hapsidospora chrysogenum ATCC 11550]